ncbi:hypothetical protein BJ944DRAFT_15470 [Cunninghamella echinulata]|nr:hypothetical protein BJ944DRAFT_15470 [Cunninghamella echinulata]
MNSENKQKSNQKPTVRKKKATRACVHCQKAHLTCDDARPCQRCIKRGLSSTCTDGVRKKAKYLQDTDESNTQPRYIPPQPTSTTTPPSAGMSQQTNSLLQSLASNTNPLDPFGTGLEANQLLDLNNYNYGFGSTAANLEYSILSNMLGSPMNQILDTSVGTPPTPTSLSNIWQSNAAENLARTIQQHNSNMNSNNNLSNNNINNNNSNNNNNNTTPVSFNNNNNNTHETQSNSTSMRNITPQSATTDTVLYSPDQNSIGSPYVINSSTTPNITSSSSSSSSSATNNNNVRMSSLSSYGEGAVVANVESPNTTLAQVKRRNQLVTPEMVYSRATKPYSYADGYHYLINYVRQKMSREDLMRISRALALFRPSVLASMLNLNEVDLIFTEKCLQRTLLEYEKLISYSGTPTVVWRRTGEIVLVGKEFSLLTQWSRDTLLNKKTYIYELMSNSSAVDYWEAYSTHAFDINDSAVYSSCILVSPTKRVVPCTYCFTIKRDIFDLPSVIIGNFLPILS